jgi:hypothetical protein
MMNAMKTGAWLVALQLVTAGLLAGCGGETESGGQLMLSVTTDMSVPEDITDVRLQVSVRGEVKHDQWYTIGRDDLRLPGTIGIVKGKKDDPVTIRVMSRLGNGYRTLREVVTTVPGNRVAHLPIKIEWLCDGTVEVTTEEKTDVPKSTLCKSGQTCIAGECRSVQVDSSTLTNYDAKDVFGGKDGVNGRGACFDVLGCFDVGAKTIRVEGDDKDCSFDADELAQEADGKGPTLAAVLPPRSQNANGDDASAGICTKDVCLVPLDRDEDAGWTIQDGRVNLPRALCKKIAAQEVLDVAHTEACAPKTPSLPVCGPWSAITTQSATPPSQVDIDLGSGEGGAGGSGAGGMSGGGGEAGGGPAPFEGCDAQVPEGDALKAPYRTLLGARPRATNVTEYEGPTEDVFSGHASDNLRRGFAAAGCNRVGVVYRAFTSPVAFGVEYRELTSAAVPVPVAPTVMPNARSALFYDGGCNPVVIITADAGPTFRQYVRTGPTWTVVDVDVSLTFGGSTVGGLELVSTDVGSDGTFHAFLHGTVDGVPRLVQATRKPASDSAWDVKARLRPPAPYRVLAYRVGRGALKGGELYALYQKWQEPCEGTCDRNLYFGKAEISSYAEEVVQNATTTQGVFTASLALNGLNQPIVAATYETHADGGKLSASELRVYKKVGTEWCHETVVTDGDDYSGKDSMKATGAQPHLAIDDDGHWFVAFSDYAQWDVSGTPNLVSGQLRIAQRTRSGWDVRTAFRQAGQSTYPVPINMFGNLAVVPSKDGLEVYAVGAERLWQASQVAPANPSSLDVNAIAVTLDDTGCKSNLDCRDGNSCTLDTCSSTSGECAQKTLTACAQPSAPTCACVPATPGGSCCTETCEPPVGGFFADAPGCTTKLDCCEWETRAKSAGFDPHAEYPNGYQLVDEAECGLGIQCLGT